MDFKKLVLGIDIGTSSVKVSLLDSHTLKSVCTKSVVTKAKINSSNQKGDEQDVAKIFKAMLECFKLLGNLLKKVYYYINSYGNAKY